jgi:hypothetical protein
VAPSICAPGTHESELTPITTFRNGAMVDVIARPVELRDDADR